MISCDKCEEWYHGKCVNVTKAMGHKIELSNKPWHCPPCRKKKLQVPGVASASKGKQSLPKKSPEKEKERHSVGGIAKSKMAALAAAKKMESEAVAAHAVMAETPKKIAADAAASRKRGSISSRKKSVDTSAEGHCVVCKKAPRKDSIYCSDGCVQKHAESMNNKGVVKKQEEHISLEDKDEKDKNGSGSSNSKQKLKVPTSFSSYYEAMKLYDAIVFE